MDESCCDRYGDGNPGVSESGGRCPGQPNRYDRAGLTNDEEVLSTVRKLAKKYHLKRIDAEYHFPLKDPKGAINTFKKSSMDESACFSYELDELERSLVQARERAYAWAS